MSTLATPADHLPHPLVVRTVALDKTGTLTANRPTVVDIATTPTDTAAPSTGSSLGDRTPGQERVLAVAAVISALLVSLWPLLAVAFAGVDQASDVVPFIQDLIRRVTGG